MSDNDWTWVLQRPCDQCGWSTDRTSRDQLGARFRAVGGEWREMLGRGGAVTRPPVGSDRTWSILEYGCHVRDVLDLLEERLRKMLKKRKPQTFKAWDHLEAADKGNYAEADPAKVAYALASNAGKVADLLDRVSGEDWDKQASRSDGKLFTLESMTRYLLHDMEHHLWDAHRILDGD